MPRESRRIIEPAGREHYNLRPRNRNAENAAAEIPIPGVRGAVRGRARVRVNGAARGRTIRADHERIRLAERRRSLLEFAEGHARFLLNRTPEMYILLQDMGRSPHWHFANYEDNEVTDSSSDESTSNDQNDVQIPEDVACKCVVCLDTYLPKHPHVTKCGHIFCKRCIFRSIRRAKKCPICRGELVKEDCREIFF